MTITTKSKQDKTMPIKSKEEALQKVAWVRQDADPGTDSVEPRNMSIRVLADVLEYLINNQTDD